MKKAAIIFVIFLLVFTAVGYLLSDHLYYSRLIKNNQLINPDRIFDWMRINNRSFKTTRDIYVLQRYQTPRHLIESHKTLYCDEGATIMATLAHELGYSTRLVDLLGMDSIAHHTVAEVFVNGQWVVYDHFNGYEHVSPTSTVDYPVSMELNKRYPKAYNYIINNNYFLKQLALKIRHIDEGPVQINKRAVDTLVKR